MPFIGPSATKSSFAIGTWNPLTDVWTQVLDLNDGATFAIMNKGLQMPQPDKSVIESGNLRTAGVVVPRWQYKARHITVELWLRNTASTTALLANIRSLLSAIENPPYSIRIAPPGATQYSYADVLAVKHDIPADPQIILAGAITKIHIDFECRVGLRGDRVTLQNLAPNPGFEQPSGGGVVVFNDNLTNVNAYTVEQGSAPTVGSQVMTIASGTILRFGSPSWGPLNLWQVRWRWATGLTATFYLHRTDLNNNLKVQVTGTAISLIQVDGGVSTTLATATVSLVNVTFYWLQMTQFPGMNNDPPYLNVYLVADSGGLPAGATLATLSTPGVSTSQAVLTGQAGFAASGANLQIGSGTFANINMVTLFGPGGWTFSPSGASSPVSGAWEQNTSNTFSTLTSASAPLTSYGALRLDAPPAGIWDTSWIVYGGGSPTGTWAIPVTINQTLGASVWVKSSGLNANAVIQLTISEYNASGTFIRNGTFGQKNGNQANWTQISGTYITNNVNTAYVNIGVRVADTTNAGESANATFWADNIQLWNQTATGVTSMPYCELRFPQSPAQLLVSGLQGDMPAPAMIALGTYQSTWAAGTTLTLMLGARATASSGAQLVVADPGDQTQGGISLVRDSGSYGGFYVSGINGYEDLPFSAHPSDLIGVYHVFSRYRSGQSGGNLATVATSAEAFMQSVPGYPSSANQVLWKYSGPSTYPLTAGSVWVVADAGQITVPLTPLGATFDPTARYLTIGATWSDNNPPQASRLNWHMLLPVDGSLLYAAVINPSTSGINTPGQWIWAYFDGIATNTGTSPAAVGYSAENLPTPNPAVATGGPGSAAGNYPSINQSADPYLTLNPHINSGSAANQLGVNQFAGVITDQVGTVLPLFTEITYSPLYLYPR